MRYMRYEIYEREERGSENVIRIFLVRVIRISSMMIFWMKSDSRARDDLEMEEENIYIYEK